MEYNKRNLIFTYFCYTNFVGSQTFFTMASMDIKDATSKETHNAENYHDVYKDERIRNERREG